MFFSDLLNSPGTMTRPHGTRLIPVALVSALTLFSQSAQAQTTRTEEIDQARLWPESESPLVRQANGLVERRFREGVADGYGANGPQVVLGGMRSGHGMSFGEGYRKTDIWSERIGVRFTGRLTIQDAYMVDGRVDFQGLQTDNSFINLYLKYESSPQMDFYGLGPFSAAGNRSSYLLEDFSTDFQAGVTLADNVRIGVTGAGGRRQDRPRPSVRCAVSNG